MARIKKAAKKSLIEGLEPREQLLAFTYGDAYVKNPSAFHCADWVHFLRESCAQSGFNPSSVFKKSEAELFIEPITRQVMEELVAVAFKCSESGNGKLLRDLADAIELVGEIKKSKPWVDKYRAWLWCEFHPLSHRDRCESRKAPTFARIREAFDNEFADSIADAQLREMVKDVGIKLARDKSGPKGPRIR